MLESPAGEGSRLEPGDNPKIRRKLVRLAEGKSQVTTDKLERQERDPSHNGEKKKPPTITQVSLRENSLTINSGHDTASKQYRVPVIA